MIRVVGNSSLLYFKTGTAAVGHTQGQAQQFRVKSAGVGAFHMRLSRAGRQTSPIAQKTLFVPISKGPVLSVLKNCPNVSSPVSEQCLLAFSASSQYYHRFNSESSAILVCSTLKTEALATASSKAQRNCKKEPSFQREQQLSSHPCCIAGIVCKRTCPACCCFLYSSRGHFA
jgi:hypothetical protein